MSQYKTKHIGIALLSALILVSMSVTLAEAITINGLFNFQGPHGGNVRFNGIVVTSRINIVNALVHLNGLTWNGGPNRGALGFDAQTGVNMTVLAVNRYIILYNVTTANPNPVLTYIHYNQNDHTPTGTNTDNINYDPATDIATVTTTGNGVVVTLNYATASSLAINNFNIFINMMPLVMIFAGLEAKQRDLINNRAFTYIMVMGACGILIVAIRLAGY